MFLKVLYKDKEVNFFTVYCNVNGTVNTVFLDI